MNFRFLHAADIHLGSPLSGLSLRDEAVAARFASAGRDAFSALVDAAIAEEAAFVVIAGDLYDGEWRDNTVGLFFNREAARLERAGIPLFTIRGNHDAESLVRKTISMPESVRELSSRTVETVRLEELRVALHGRSFPDRAVTENLALTYPDALPGWFNIGVLHTSLTGRPGHDTYAPCALDDLRSRGYDYWALGHVHEYEEVARDPLVIFPGNLQGRSVRECGPKGAVLVEVADGRIAETRRLILDRARWALVRVDASGVEEPAALDAAIDAALGEAIAAADGRLVALRVVLEGETPLAARIAAEVERWRDEVQAIAHRHHEDVWLERLKLALRPPARATVPHELAALDLDAMLGELEADPGVLAEVQAILGELRARMPADAATAAEELFADPAALLEEARALVLGRLTGAGD